MALSSAPKPCQSGDVAVASDSWLDIPEVCARLNLSPSRVHRLIEDRALLATKREGHLMVPAIFITDDGPLPHLAGTATLLIDGGFSDEGVLDWLLEPLDELGASPAEALAQGRKTQVRRIAQALAI